MNGDVVALNAELSRTYLRLAEVTRQLADEQALIRELRVIVALAPYNDVRRPRLSRRRR